MASIPEQIDKIIDLRKSRVDELKSLREQTQTAYTAVKEFTRMQSELKNKYNDLPLNEKEGPENRIALISTDEFFECYDEFEKQLETLIERLNRDSLHISFIGRAGQGKSLLMQKISGLPGSVIPSAEGDDCTGAKSIITNVDGIGVSATIVFFTEKEMIDIVNRYLHKITHGKQKIYSVNEIRRLSIPVLSDDMVEENTLADQLQKYIDYYDEYSDKLGTTLTVQEEEIEEYVAQHHHDDPSIRYHKYLGVRLAKINCPFPYKDAGKIVLVDTIGIGAATSHGTEEDMLNAAQYDSDAIVFLFRPDSLRPSLSDKEIQIIKKISERVTPDYSREMLFWVVNRVETGTAQNAKSIPMIMKSIENKNFPVAEVLNIDCNNAREVEEGLLKTVLERLSLKITSVDQRLIDNLNELGESLYEKYHYISQQTDRAFAKSASADMKREFAGIIEDTYEIQVLGRLRDLYLNKYNTLRQQVCIELMKKSEEKLRSIITCVPSVADIEKQLYRGSTNQLNAYERCTDYMRLYIINEFTTLNEVLDNLVECLKQEVIHILTEDKSGRLGKICPTTGRSSNEWIQEFLKKTDAEHQYPLLAQALCEFSFYTINVQGFIIPAIRNELDPIDITLSGAPDIYSNLKEKNAVAKEIRERLQTKAFEVRDKIELALQKLYSEPNKSMFAALKDFYDRLTYSSDGDGRNKSALEQWKYLYEDWMHLIWKDEYQAKSSIHLIAEQWNDAVENLKDKDSIQNFNIIRGGNI